MRILLFVVALGLVLPRAAAAQAPAAPPDLKGALTDLSMAVAALPADLRSPRLTRAVEWLDSAYGRTKPEEVSDEYARSLRRAADLLRTQARPEIVEDVTTELEAKVDHCRALGIGMGGTVLLRVNTRRGSGTVGGWEVRYLLKFDEWLKTPAKNFLRVSSPAETTMEPGRYVVWALDPASGRMTDRKLVEVKGQKELVLDLVVP